MTTRATTWVAPILMAALLAGCTQDPGVAARQPTATPPTSTGAAASGTGSTPSPTGVAAKYVFPVRSAKASFGRAHHDYPATDIFAPCGTQVLAVTSAVVTEVSRKDDWTSRKNDGATRGGLSVTLIGTDGVRYYASHLKSVVAGIVPGRRVRAGEVLGVVGQTGSARGTPCHLHFGISPPCPTGDWWNRRGVLTPYPFLTSWQGRGQLSPIKAVTDWRAAHGCPKSPA